MTDTTFAALPVATGPDGHPRLTGVEIEFSGLSPAETADIAADVLGGTVTQAGDHAWQVRGTAIGDLDIYLDTALRHAGASSLKQLGLALGQGVIPVEIVTEPLDLEQMARLDTLRAALRRAGAAGSRAGLTYGFGVHFNPSVAGRDADAITRPLLAYALIEDWMRQARPIDRSRQVLPFTDPYPTSLVRALCKAGVVAPEEAMTIYLAHAASRNYGLDMMPLFAWLDADRVRAALGEDKTSARPAFHFRLPDCRIDEAGWTLAQEWDRWRLVECVAADRDLLARLRTAWLDDHGAVTLRRSPWAAACGAILADAGLIAAEAMA